MSARQYVENDLMDKSPVELIRLLYSKAIEKLQRAARHTRAGEVRERNNCLARVMEIVAELQGALNLEAGGEVAFELARLYDYVQRQLIDAAGDPAAVAPLEEVRLLFANLYEGWNECEPPAAERQVGGEEAPGPRADGQQAGVPEGWAAVATSDRGAAWDNGADRERDADEAEYAAEDLPSPPAAADYGTAGGDRVWTL